MREAVRYRATALCAGRILKSPELPQPVIACAGLFNQDKKRGGKFAAPSKSNLTFQNGDYHPVILLLIRSTPGNSNRCVRGVCSTDISSVNDRLTLRTGVNFCLEGERGSTTDQLFDH